MANTLTASKNGVTVLPDLPEGLSIDQIRQNIKQILGDNVNEGDWFVYGPQSGVCAVGPQGLQLALAYGEEKTSKARSMTDGDQIALCLSETPISEFVSADESSQYQEDSAELIAELEQIEDKGGHTIIGAAGFRNVAEAIDNIKRGTPDGRKLVKLHREVKKRMNPE